MQSKSDRTPWIDMARGLCMMAILWFHSEAYHCEDLLTPYSMYTNTVLGCFFFISGYLLYPSTWQASHKYHSVWRWLLVPYIVFTLIIAAMKLLLHYGDANWQQLLTDVVLGRASWFVAAMIVAQSVMVGVLHLSKDHLGAVAVLGVVGVILSALVSNETGPWHISADLWSVNEALVGIVCMSMGYVYHTKEEKVCRQRQAWIAVTGVALVILKILIWRLDLLVTFAPVRMTYPLVFYADILCGSVFICLVMRGLPRLRILEWTGRHCIVYYFFCGAVPMGVSWALHKIGMTGGSYPSVAVVFVLSWIVCSIVAWAVYRYTRIVR